MCVSTVRVCVSASYPQICQHLAAPDHPAAILHQVVQDLELERREVERLAVPPRFERSEVHPDVAEREGEVLVRPHPAEDRLARAMSSAMLNGLVR